MYSVEIRRSIILVALLGLAIAACGGAAVTTTVGGSSAPELTEAAPATTGAGPTTTNSNSPPTTPQPGDGTTSTTSGRPIAPDFTLELGAGGSYTLSEGEKPVYLVFWAEW